MTAENYQKIISFLRAAPLRERLSKALVKHLPKLFFAVYAVELFFLTVQFYHAGLAANQGILLFGALLMPALCLLTSTLLRKKLDHKRPYEVFPITPLIPKDTHGHSFPSNHTASAFVLALTAFRLSFPLGIIMTVLAVLTGLSRIAAGLHWPKDVFFGAGIGLFFGILELTLF